jgi:hypothetical protein
MHFATRVRTWRVARLYSEIALSRKPFGIGNTYIYNLLLRMTDTVTSQNIDFPAGTLYIVSILKASSDKKLKGTSREVELLGLDSGQGLKRAERTLCRLLACSAYSSTLKMDAIFFFRDVSKPLRFRKPRLTAVGICCADHATPSTCKSWH